ncbi:MAG: putative zinc-binding metallopeptidase, partial [Bryobacteraceae bacterium]
VFGSPDTEYTPDTYRPRPYSRSFVRHLDNWYAQSHPDEDFAETFAVWLAMAPEEWRARYRGWKALDKLEYVDQLIREAAGRRPAVIGGRRISQAGKLRKTLVRHYAARRKQYAEDFPDFHDPDLVSIFHHGQADGEPAARLMRRNRKLVVESIVRWTGQRKYAVNMLVRKLIERCDQLKLSAPADQARLSLDLAAYLAALVTNHLHTGRFKRRV